MNREIKFRAWDGNKFHYFTALSGLYGVLNPILMQFAGLRDKNGNEIYEGDIVDSWSGIEGNNGETYLRKVVWDESGLRFEPLTGYTLCKANEHLFEVIGNIYETPELIA